MQIRYNAIRSIAQTGRNSTSLPFCVVVFARTYSVARKRIIVQITVLIETYLEVAK